MDDDDDDLRRFWRGLFIACIGGLLAWALLFGVLGRLLGVW